MLLARLLPHKQFQSLRVICDTMYDTGTAIFCDKKETIIEEGNEGKQQLRENTDMLSVLRAFVYRMNPHSYSPLAQSGRV